MRRLSCGSLIAKPNDQHVLRSLLLLLFSTDNQRMHISLSMLADQSQREVDCGQSLRSGQSQQRCGQDAQDREVAIDKFDGDDAGCEASCQDSVFSSSHALSRTYGHVFRLRALVLQAVLDARPFFCRLHRVCHQFCSDGSPFSLIFLIPSAGNHVKHLLKTP